MTEKTFKELYRRQKESGLTVKEFCTNEGIAPSTYYNWQKKLNEPNRLPDFIPVAINAVPSILQSKQPDDATLTKAHHVKDTTSIEIEFANKTILRIKNEIDLSVIKALIHLTD